MDTTSFGALILLLFILIFYLLPSIISTVRDTDHGTAIWMVNMFLGWTIILGWIAALIWAIIERPMAEKTA